MIARKLLLFITFATLWSCSNISVREVADRSDDSFSNEAFLRYSETSLENLKSPTNQEIIGCYKKDFENSLKKLKEKFEARKNKPEYWNQIGTCYYLANDLPKAMSFYQQAIDIARTRGIHYPPPFNNLGLIFLKKGSYQKAHFYLKKAIDTAPRYLTPKFNLSGLYIKFGMTNKAQKLLMKIYNNKKHDFEVLALLGTLHIQENKINRALYFFSQIKKLYIKRPHIAVHYALALYLGGEHNRAKELLNYDRGQASDEINKLHDKLLELINSELAKKG
ncbi:MAG: tetratricopeptide repeat protein [Bacteriovoracaceae bacterium]|nr:tetratricopeptide repeat protein [Bacteriovoracaceae bacterium]